MHLSTLLVAFYNPMKDIDGGGGDAEDSYDTFKLK